MDTMLQQQELLQTYLKKANISLSKKPEGRISTFINHHCVQYCWKSPHSNKWVYLSKKEMKLIQALAQKDYDQRFINAAKKLARSIEWLIHIGAVRELHDFYQSLAQVYSNLSEPRQKLVIPYVLPDDLYAAAWKEVSYEGKEFWDGDPMIRTDQGERVRSKSEKMIADKLLQLRIPYRYEAPLRTEELGIVFPDFTLLDVWNRKEVILEHFGMMGDEEYCEKMIRKYYAYIQEGYVPGIDFLFTMETGNLPMDTYYLEKMLRYRFPHVS